MSDASTPRRLGAIVVRLVLLVVFSVATAFLIASFFLPGALAADSFMAAIRSDVLDIPPLDEADTPPQNSYIYAADGTELAELTFEENRVPVELDEVPQVVIDAVLATEDAEFFEHEGVHHLAIARAALTNFRAGGIESGASTITQQYVKLTYLSPEQTLARKVEEAIYAVRVEDDLSKEEILERYLNRSYFGSGVYGIGTAAERYFSKEIGDLELGEAAMLAGLLRAPEANNPINSLENAEARRDIVLRQMAHHGFVSTDQAATAADAPLEVEISEPPAPEYPFFSRWVSQLLVNEGTASQLGTQLAATQAMGATVEERHRRVFQSGLRIHTTLDLEMQDAAEDSLLEYLTYEDEPAEEVAQEPAGAIVSVEPGTGAIKAMALGPHGFGGCRSDDSWVGELDSGELLCDRTEVNPAVPGGGGSGRQPGSAFKPILDTAALEAGISPGYVLDARGPREIDGCPTHDGEPYEVRNTGGDGILDMYEAVAQSSNVYHALLIAEIGPEAAADMMQRVSGYPVPERDVVCPLALGAGSTTPMAMATAYATFANRGEYCAPHPIERIEDADGRIVWEHDHDCRQVVDTEIADRIVDILAGPVSSAGTAPVADLGEWPTRGKTGSTNNNVDAWFVGFVRQLATAAWVGFPNTDRVFASAEQAEAACGDAAVEDTCRRTAADAQRLVDVTIGGEHYSQVFGGSLPAPMWASYMRTVVERYEPENFVDPGPIPTGMIPDLLAADDLEEAEDLAREAGFRLTTEEVAHWRSAGTFVEQDPSAGERQPLGSRITLGISDGEGSPPPVPDVLGLTLDEAAAVLFDAGYDVFHRPREVEDDDLVDRVVGMSPGPGTPLLPNRGDDSGVTLDIGVLAPEPEEEDDDGDDGDDADGDDGGGDDGGSDDQDDGPQGQGNGATGDGSDDPDDDQGDG